MRDDRRADTVVVDQQNPRATHRDAVIARLHELAARRVRGDRQAVAGMFFRRADVEEIGRAARVVKPGAGRRVVERADAEAPRQRLRAFSCKPAGSERWCIGITARAAAFEFEARERPALRAVFEREHIAADAEIA
ncbi:hypothetical protein [Candidatus Burkholderia verschuerenii]|uniref:hypothetical protein n=1 Tax=Candidatus Burkholderia verschuerenii TaxID=242163 RepID=UPI002FC2BA72